MYEVSPVSRDPTFENDLEQKCSKRILSLICISVYPSIRFSIWFRRIVWATHSISLPKLERKLSLRSYLSSCLLLVYLFIFVLVSLSVLFSSLSDLLCLILVTDLFNPLLSQRKLKKKHRYKRDRDAPHVHMSPNVLHWFNNILWTLVLLSTRWDLLSSSITITYFSLEMSTTARARVSVRACVWFLLGPKAKRPIFYWYVDRKLASNPIFMKMKYEFNRVSTWNKFIDSTIFIFHFVPKDWQLNIF